MSDGQSEGGMTGRGKFVLTLLILAVVGFGVWRWWDKIAPPPQQPPQVNPADVQRQLDELKARQQPGAAQPGAVQPGPAGPEAPATVKSLPGMVGGEAPVAPVPFATIPKVQAASSYEKAEKNGKQVVKFPINVWPGWAPIITANGGMAPNENSVFFRKYGFYVELSLVDNPLTARDLFVGGKTHVLWGTLDMIALFAPELCRDTRTVPVVCQQIDWSDGGDGIVVRGDIRNVNDLRPRDGKRRTIVLAQNSPSHYFLMSLLFEANVDPSTVDFEWAADAPSAAKLFIGDKKYDAFVGWAPDIYIATDPKQISGTRLLVTTDSANHMIADVWAVRNDYFRDHPGVVANLARGIFEGMDMVRKDPALAAKLMAAAYNLPVADCEAMIGKDGGIAEGDAHLTNYRENWNFFLDDRNPSNFDVVWNRASVIYKSLGAIDRVIPAETVKAKRLIADMAQEYRDVRDLGQPTFKEGTSQRNPEAGDDEIITKSVQIKFPPSKSVLDLSYDPTIPGVLDEIGKLAGAFGNAYIFIEGNTDASKRGIVPVDAVRQLSWERADAVRRALIEKFKFDPHKFRVVGNGWDNPAPGCTDPTNIEHNKKNRRVEVKVVPLEKDE